MEKILSVMIVLVAALLFVPGCFAEEASVTEVVADAPVEEVVAAEPVVEVAQANYTADFNTTSLEMNVNETVLVSLEENPTTGYEWNMTPSAGLEIVSSEFVPAKDETVGAPGVHEWILKAIESGNQVFSGADVRSFEEPAGNETAYTLEIVVA